MPRTSRLLPRIVLSMVLLVGFLGTRAVADIEVGVMRILKQSHPDWKPQAIVDVGANVGGWTGHVLSNVYPSDTPVLMLEATPKHEQSLEGVKKSFPNVDYSIALLSSQDDKKIQFYQGGNTGNSMFRETTQHYANDTGVERTTVSLDTAVARSFLKDKRVDYLKLDVQGAELIVLRGATKLMQQVTFVQLEASLVEYNHGGICFSELTQFLEGHGFRLYNFSDLNRNVAFKTKGTGQFDVLFIRPDSENLPSFIQENNAQFCNPTLPSLSGLLPATTAADADDPITSSAAATTTPLPSSGMLLLPVDVYALDDAMAELFHLVILVLGFLSGYIVGRWSSAHSTSKPSHHHSPRRRHLKSYRAEDV